MVLDPSFYGASSQEEVELRPPTEVPDWVAEAMAAGPPLAETPGPAASSPPVREVTCGKGVPEPCREEEESAKKWESRVKKAGFPQPPEVVRALEAGDTAKLSELAAGYEAKTRTLVAGADPKKDRERAAVTGSPAPDRRGSGPARADRHPASGRQPRERLMAVARRTLVSGDDLLEPKLGFEQ